MAYAPTDITLGGFIVVAIIAIGLMLFARRDRWRSIRFGFFFEHERKRDDAEEDDEGQTRIMWPKDRGEKEKEE